MIAGVVDPRSTGIRTYAEHLHEALALAGFDYELSRRSRLGAGAHFHLGNSTRALLPDMLRRREPFVVTLHDVLPRLPVLRPLYRALLLPAVLRRASCVIVHSEHAAELLTTNAFGRPPSRLEVIPHAAPTPSEASRARARGSLASQSLSQLADEGPPLFVLAGTLKRAKLVAETIEAAQPLIRAGRMRLLFAGAVGDERIARTAGDCGAMLLRSPDAETYQRAIVAADVVLCARADSVGESNGPLLDAIGAGRPSLVTDVGSASELAGESAVVVTPTLRGIRDGIDALLDTDERRRRAASARSLAREFSAERVAAQHAAVFTSLGWA